MSLHFLFHSLFHFVWNIIFAVFFPFPSIFIVNFMDHIPWSLANVLFFWWFFLFHFSLVVDIAYRVFPIKFYCMSKIIRIIHLQAVQISYLAIRKRFIYFILSRLFVFVKEMQCQPLVTVWWMRESNCWFISFFVPRLWHMAFIFKTKNNH